MPRAWVIEDNDLNFELVEFLLEEAGWEVVRARDGVEFEALIDSPSPDAVLLDMNLPDVSGLDLAGRLRASPHHAAVRILAVTAHAMQGDKERFLAAGCDGYVAKPIEKGLLFAALAARPGGGPS